MISNTFLTNTFVGGMDLDTDVSMLSDNKYRYAENVRVITNDSGTTGVLLNIDDIELYTSILPENETIIGTTTINNIGIVITRLSSSINKVYRITNFDTNNPTITVILLGELSLCSNLSNNSSVSIVSNYETDTNVKIYFTDGESYIKVLNIVDDKYVGTSATNPLVDADGNILNPKSIDIIPSVVLQPLVITNLTSGNLLSGNIQYCYQLFNLHESETTTSSLSNMVHLTTSTTDQNSQDYYGTDKDKTSTKGCILNIPILNHNFNMCRIISILYVSNTESPLIKIVDEFPIGSDSTSITYTDKGSGTLSQLTLDEFNALTGYQFIAQVLAKKNNRLFAANITDTTFDPSSYDARAYRCNEQGIIELQSSDSLGNLHKWMDTSDLTLIPKTHDCINPFNTMDFGLSLEMSSVSGMDVDGTSYTGDYNVNYVYGQTGYIEGTPEYGNRYYGGHGPNIDYNFITVPLTLSESLANDRLDNNCSMNVPPETLLPLVNSLVATSVGSGVATAINFPSTISKRLMNYADPYISSRFKSYLRDEVYRFGIVFYNEKNIASPVYWIGDIRMPHASESGFEPFYYDTSSNKLMARALGLKFTVRNIPSGATAYEIVRCDRTESDRTIITQGVLSNIGEYRIQELDTNAGNGTVLETSIEARPTVILNYLLKDLKIEQVGEQWGRRGYLRKDLIKLDYAKFISPEVCFLENIESYFENNAYIDSIYSVASLITLNDLPTANTGFTFSRNFAEASKILNSDGNELSVSKSAYTTYDTESSLTGESDLYIAAFDYLLYNAYIAKYYMIKTYVNGDYLPNITANIIDAKITTDIAYNGFMNVTPYRMNIGNITYTNFGMSSFNETGENRLPTLGPSGTGMILYIPGLNTLLPRFNTMSYVGISTIDADVINTIPVVNIKRNINQYDGNTYTSRLNSIYITTNEYTKVPDNYWSLPSSQRSLSNYTYGGDTFLNLLDYPTTMTFQANEETYWLNSRRFIGAYIPLESSINMNLFNGDMAHRTYRSNDNYLDSHLEYDITQKGTYHILDKPYYLYNSAYSSLQNSKKYILNSIYAESDIKNFNRILVSLVKTNNETSDSWTKFKVADYLDVDNQYGKLTNLYVFKDKLFFWQDTSVGVASTNERSLITDNNIGELVLGTGDILTRYDYITSTNGSSIKNDKSICNSNSSLYWYDYDKNEICIYNNGVNPISKQKNVQTYLNSLFNAKSKTTLGFYDKKYNEVWFKFLDKSLIFNELLDAYTSFYTFNPDYSLLFSDKIVTLKDNKFYTVNPSGITGMTKLGNTAKIELVINKDVLYSKVFDNVRLSGEFLGENDEYLTTSGIGLMKFTTKSQSTGEYLNIVFDYREDTYRFGIPRAINSSSELSYPARLRGKYLICNYTFDNIDTNRFKIPYITTTYRYSLI